MQPKRLRASVVGWSPGSDDGRPERENMNKLLRILDAHGVIYEVIGERTVKTFTVAYSDDFDIIEVIGTTAYLNGSSDFNIWDWLGY